MKNVLFTTTALVALGGAAFAGGHTSINFGGSAEIGIKMQDTGAATAPNDGTWRFHHDMDLDITFSGTLDNGLTFGADIDLDELDNQSTPGDIGDNSGNHTVFVSGAFGTITIGDTDGAFDKALTEVAAGSTIDDAPEHANWSGNDGLDGLYDGQIARYDYAFGDITFSLSAELDDTDDAATTSALDGDPILGLGVAWKGDFGGTAIGVGLGYQTVDISLDGNGTGLTGDHEVYGISLSAGFGAITAVLNYTDESRPTGVVETQYTGISLEYTAGDLTLGANYGQKDRSNGNDTDGFGLWATYAIGDGVDLVAGYSDSETGATTSTKKASIGLGLSF